MTRFTTRSALVFALALVTLSASRAAADPPTQKLLHTIGALGASSIYSIYVQIGLLGDAYAAKAYEADTAGEIAKEAANMAKQLAKTFNELEKSGVDKDDQKSCKEMAGILNDLEREASALERYIRTKSKEDAAEFDRARKTAWPKIKTLLGIK